MNFSILYINGNEYTRVDVGEALTPQLAICAFLRRQPWAHCSDVACVCETDLLEEIAGGNLRSVDRETRKEAASDQASAVGKVPVASRVRGIVGVSRPPIHGKGVYCVDESHLVMRSVSDELLAHQSASYVDRSADVCPADDS